jgi:hypothetical protein
MKFHSFFASTALTIATIVSAYPALSQQTTTVQAPQTVNNDLNINNDPNINNDLNKGQTFFSASPRLVRSIASMNSPNVSSTYEFTLAVPANAGQPLKAVTIAQAENLETIQFDLNRSQAFAGDRYAAGSVIPLANIGGEQPKNSRAVTIVFAQPVQPGHTVTVALEATNPNFGGVYEFGVTAYPAGENGLGQFLGFGRLNFYGNGH